MVGDYAVAARRNRPSTQISALKECFSASQLAALQYLGRRLVGEGVFPRACVLKVAYGDWRQCTLVIGTLQPAALSMGFRQTVLVGKASRTNAVAKPTSPIGRFCPDNVAPYEVIK